MKYKLGNVILHLAACYVRMCLVSAGEVQSPGVSRQNKATWAGPGTPPLSPSLDLFLLLPTPTHTLTYTHTCTHKRMHAHTNVCMHTRMHSKAPRQGSCHHCLSHFTGVKTSSSVFLLWLKPISHPESAARLDKGLV